MFRNRYWLAPLKLLIPLALAGALLHLLARGWWIVPSLAAAAAITTLWLWGALLTAHYKWLAKKIVWDWVDHNRNGILDSPREMIYTSGILAASGLWLTLAMAFGPQHLILPLIIGGILGAIPWWKHHLVRRRLLCRWNQRWKKRAHHVKGWEGSWVKDVDVTEDGVVTLEIKGRRHAKYKDVQGTGNDLVSAFSGRLRAGAITIYQGYAVRDFTVRIVPTNPWADTIMHPLFEEVDA